jgi:regulator of protease activity HflC (stomatin/prohibitin superfamily)
MKKVFLLVAMFIALSLSMTSCYLAKPDPGTEGVLVMKPWFFGDGGVDPTPVNTGSTWCVTTTDCEYFVITPITYTEDFTNMMPRDNTPVSFSAYAKILVISGKTPILYSKFGKKWYTESVKEQFRTMVRIHACKYTMFELTSNREVSIRIQDTLYQELKRFIEKNMLPIEVQSVVIGSVTPPEQVLTETKNTAAQNQSILTQSARANAELSRKQAEVNKAIADKAYQNQMGMTVEQYLHLRQLEIEKEKVELIKDNKNATVIFGQSVPLSYPVK